MRVNRVVVLEPCRQLSHHGLCIGERRYPGVIAFDGAHEGFRHSIRLRALHWCGPGFEADLASKSLGLMGDVV
jgi:hypothetical protein